MALQADVPFIEEGDTSSEGSADENDSDLFQQDSDLFLHSFNENGQEATEIINSRNTASGSSGYGTASGSSGCGTNTMNSRNSASSLSGSDSDGGTFPFHEYEQKYPQHNKLKKSTSNNLNSQSGGRPQHFYDNQNVDQPHFYEKPESEYRNGPVTFHKHGQQPQVVSKPGTKRPSSHFASDQLDQELTVRTKMAKYDQLAQPAKSEPLRSTKAIAMMKKMGFQEGEGLGKQSQGRVDPVELSKQRGRRGLGLTLPGLEPADLKWDSSFEVVSVEEVPTFIKNNNKLPITAEELKGWIQYGPISKSIEEFTAFCDSSIIKRIVEQKSIFDNLDPEEMRKARTRSNVFETIGKGIFQNRAAMKMANIETVTGSGFVEIKDQTGVPMVRTNELMYFADVCSGPGGFSEYVFFHKAWRAKGFGFTLKGENDFKLSEFIAGPCESFEPFYGVKEDGDIFEPDNIESFMHFVMDNTEQLGVHFMMADGGFSVEGQENIQELLSKQLYLCQMLVALCIVRNGGHFVCKLFDIFSPFSVGLIYLMRRAFEEISIHKPNSSRPANSERYLICKWKRHDCEPTRQYLFDLNKELWRLRNQSKDVTHCVPMEEIEADSEFMDYIIESNNTLGERQIINLIKIAAFCRDPNLQEAKQSEIRRACLAYWKVPDTARKIKKTTAEEIASRCLPNFDLSKIKTGETKLVSESQLCTKIQSVYDWYAVPIGTEKDHHLFVGLGRNQVYRLALGGGFWTKVDMSQPPKLNVELSPGTMLYGESVTEYQGMGKGQMKTQVFHIIDAISLGHEQISHLHYTERLRLCQLFAEAMNKSSRTDLCKIKVKRVYELQDLNQLFQSLTYCEMKRGQNQLLLESPDKKAAFKPEGVMFLKATRGPWMRTFSRTHKCCYYHSAKFPKDSKFDAHRPKDACLATIDSICQRLVWKWEAGVGLHKESSIDGVLHKDSMLNFIKKSVVR